MHQVKTERVERENSEMVLAALQGKETGVFTSQADLRQELFPSRVRVKQAAWRACHILVHALLSGYIAFLLEALWTTDVSCIRK